MTRDSFIDHRHSWYWNLVTHCFCCQVCTETRTPDEAADALEAADKRVTR